MQRELVPAVLPIIEGLICVQGIRSVVLFGSVARDEATASSDIDLLVAFDTDGPPEGSPGWEDVHRVLRAAEAGSHRRVQAVFSNRRHDGLDPAFVEQALREGLVLLARGAAVDAGGLALEPHSLIHYSLRGLPPSDKMRAKRALYGHRTRRAGRDGRVYVSESEGFVKGSGGVRTGIASFVVPEAQADEAERVLERLGASYRRLRIWMERV